jgi:FAD/FMN-containing dehydrogenase
MNLSGLNSIKISHAKRTLTVGTGTKLGDVHKALDPLRLKVLGGRSADVRVRFVTCRYLFL